MEAARLPYFSCVPRRSARIRVRSATPLGLEFRKNLDKLLKTEAILAYRVGYPKPEMQRATSRGGSRQVARARGEGERGSRASVGAVGRPPGMLALERSRARALGWRRAVFAVRWRLHVGCFPQQAGHGRTSRANPEGELAGAMEAVEPRRGRASVDEAGRHRRRA